jgi:hypothetical protein
MSDGDLDALTALGMEPPPAAEDVVDQPLESSGPPDVVKEVVEPPLESSEPPVEDVKATPAVPEAEPEAVSWGSGWFDVWGPPPTEKEVDAKATPETPTVEDAKAAPGEPETPPSLPPVTGSQAGGGGGGSQKGASSAGASSSSPPVTGYQAGGGGGGSQKGASSAGAASASPPVTGYQAGGGDEDATAAPSEPETPTVEDAKATPGEPETPPSLPPVTGYQAGGDGGGSQTAAPGEPETPAVAEDVVEVNVGWSHMSQAQACLHCMASSSAGPQSDWDAAGFPQPPWHRFFPPIPSLARPLDPDGIEGPTSGIRSASHCKTMVGFLAVFGFLEPSSRPALGLKVLPRTTVITSQNVSLGGLSKPLCMKDFRLPFTKG